MSAPGSEPPRSESAARSPVRLSARSQSHVERVLGRGAAKRLTGGAAPAGTFHAARYDRILWSPVRQRRASNDGEPQHGDDRLASWLVDGLLEDESHLRAAIEGRQRGGFDEPIEPVGGNEAGTDTATSGAFTGSAALHYHRVCLGLLADAARIDETLAAVESALRLKPLTPPPQATAKPSPPPPVAGDTDTTSPSDGGVETESTPEVADPHPAARFDTETRLLLRQSHRRLIRAHGAVSALVAELHSATHRDEVSREEAEGLAIHVADLRHAVAAASDERDAANLRCSEFEGLLASLQCELEEAREVERRARSDQHAMAMVVELLPTLDETETLEGATSFDSGAAAVAPALALLRILESNERGHILNAEHDERVLKSQALNAIVRAAERRSHASQLAELEATRESERAATAAAHAERNLVQAARDCGAVIADEARLRAEAAALEAHVRTDAAFLFHGERCSILAAHQAGLTQRLADAEADAAAQRVSRGAAESDAIAAKRQATAASGRARALADDVVELEARVTELEAEVDALRDENMNTSAALHRAASDASLLARRGAGATAGRRAVAAAVDRGVQCDVGSSTGTKIPWRIDLRAVVNAACLVCHFQVATRRPVWAAANDGMADSFMSQGSFAAASSFNFGSPERSGALSPNASVTSPRRVQRWLCLVVDIIAGSLRLEALAGSDCAQPQTASLFDVPSSAIVGVAREPRQPCLVLTLATRVAPVRLWFDCAGARERCFEGISLLRGTAYSFAPALTAPRGGDAYESVLDTAPLRAPPLSTVRAGVQLLHGAMGNVEVGPPAAEAVASLCDSADLRDQKLDDERAARVLASTRRYGALLVQLACVPFADILTSDLRTAAPVVVVATVLRDRDGEPVTARDAAFVVRARLQELAAAQTDAAHNDALRRFITVATVVFDEEAAGLPALFVLARQDVVPLLMLEAADHCVYDAAGTSNTAAPHVKAAVLRATLRLAETVVCVTALFPPSSATEAVSSPSPSRAWLHCDDADHQMVLVCPGSPKQQPWADDAGALVRRAHTAETIAAAPGGVEILRVATLSVVDEFCTPWTMARNVEQVQEFVVSDVDGGATFAMLRVAYRRPAPVAFGPAVHNAAPLDTPPATHDSSASRERAATVSAAGGCPTTVVQLPTVELRGFTTTPQLCGASAVAAVALYGNALDDCNVALEDADGDRLPEPVAPLAALVPAATLPHCRVVLSVELRDSRIATGSFLLPVPSSDGGGVTPPRVDVPLVCNGVHFAVMHLDVAVL